MRRLPLTVQRIQAVAIDNRYAVTPNELDFGRLPLYLRTIGIVKVRRKLPSRLSEPVSSRLFHSLLLLCGWLVGTNDLVAQRVQFPTQAPNYGNSSPVYPPSSQPGQLNAPLSSAPNFDPYSDPSTAAPPADIPYNVTPQYGQPVLPQAAPPATPGVPQQGGSLFPNGVPFQWESGAYQYQNPDGTVARLQRFLQQISWEQTWLYGDDGAREFQINRTELAATFGLPVFYNPDTPLLVTPGFAFNWLEGPATTGVMGPDMPPRMFDAYLDGAWHPQFNDWFSADLGLRTGVWTDFEELNGDSLRILGRGLGVLSFSPRLDLHVGAWYLDRNRVKLLPAGGLHWRPNNLWDAYLVFPNPKIRRRSITMGSSQWWIYFAGEYGGGRWTVERLAGGDDIDYNDIRVIFGIEWETMTQARGHFEVAYVWDRELRFSRPMAPEELRLEDTIMLRAGVDF